MDKALINQLKGSVVSSLVAARAYREMRHVEGITYEVGTDRKFADAMWIACMNNIRSSMKTLQVLTRKAAR